MTDPAAIARAPGTKMVRRSDVMAVVSKEIAKQWQVCEAATECGNSYRAIHTRSRLDQLRIIKHMLAAIPSFVEAEYASDATIPVGTEWGERVQLAIHATDSYVDASLPMHRLLSDLRLSLDMVREESDIRADALLNAAGGGS